jgi:DNA-directed RNA polymerase specialized sigma24 family protein
MPEALDYTRRMVLALCRNYARLRSGVTLKAQACGDRVQADSRREDVLVALCDIDRSMTALNPPEHTTMCHVMAGHDDRDTAELLDVAVGTVHARISRATEKMFEFLAKTCKEK